MKIFLKQTKGITLVALVITIVVLLILATVTIRSINEDSIFAHANNAATRYTIEAEKENTLITEWINKMGEQGGGGGGTTTDFSRVAGIYYSNGNSSTNLGVKLNADGTFEGYTSDGPSTFYGTYTVNENTITAISATGYDVTASSKEVRNIELTMSYSKVNGTPILTIVGVSADGENNIYTAGTQFNKISVLAYKTAYAGKMPAGTSGDVDVDFYFLEGRNKVIVVVNNTEGLTRLLNYSYDPATNAMNIIGGDCTLSADGTTITYGERSFTLTNRTYSYSTAAITTVDIDLCNGIYYNATANKMLLIKEFASENALIFVIENGNTHVSPSSYFASELASAGVTIDDSTHITYGGIQYELLSSI